jgi:hypothetical protein
MLVIRHLYEHIYCQFGPNNAWPKIKQSQTQPIHCA